MPGEVETVPKTRWVPRGHGPTNPQKSLRGDWRAGRDCLLTELVGFLGPIPSLQNAAANSTILFVAKALSRVYFLINSCANSRIVVNWVGLGNERIISCTPASSSSARRRRTVSR